MIVAMDPEEGGGLTAILEGKGSYVTHLWQVPRQLQIWVSLGLSMPMLPILPLHPHASCCSLNIRTLHLDPNP